VYHGDDIVNNAVCVTYLIAFATQKERPPSRMLRGLKRCLFSLLRTPHFERDYIIDQESEEASMAFSLSLGVGATRTLHGRLRHQSWWQARYAQLSPRQSSNEGQRLHPAK
jgi:hypothetical protein